MHLIAPDGQEYWIERTSLSPTIALPLTAPLKLADVYAKGAGKPGGTERETPIIHKRSDDQLLLAGTKRSSVPHLNRSYLSGIEIMRRRDFLGISQ